MKLFSRHTGSLQLEPRIHIRGQSTPKEFWIMVADHLPPLIKIPQDLAPLHDLIHRHTIDSASENNVLNMYDILQDVEADIQRDQRSTQDQIYRETLDRHLRFIQHELRQYEHT